MRNFPVSAKTSDRLLTQFSTSVTWNGIFYLVHKLLAIGRTTIFYRLLPTNLFSLWATSMSSLFLTILWLDGGLRKSVPRYTAAYSFTSSHQWFIMTIIRWYLIILTAITPIWYIFAGHLFCAYTALITAIFVAESLNALACLLYHSHFWHKEFNALHTIIMALTTAIHVLFVIKYPPETVLPTIFGIQLAGSILVFIAAAAYAPVVYRRTYNERGVTAEQVKHGVKGRELVTHTGIMWATMVSKSITERNALVPFFTIIFGPAIGNIFKVGQESALFVHRLIMKAIGTTDTLLLTHAYTQGEQMFIEKVLKKIATKIAALCLPLSGILLCVLARSDLFFADPFIFHVFYLMVTCYLVESTLSLYERVLEVQRAYKGIFIAYVPYIFVISIALSFNIFSSIGLIGSILVIQGVRLVSLLCMTYYACCVYGVPFSRVTGMTIVSVVLPLVIYYLVM